jgi:hypothetical protein
VVAVVTLHTTAPLVWEHDGRAFRAVVNVLPDLADWPTHQPGCCQPGCPATVNGRDPAGCVLRLTGTCVGCRCGSPVRPHG